MRVLKYKPSGINEAIGKSADFDVFLIEYPLLARLFRLKIDLPNCQQYGTQQIKARAQEAAWRLSYAVLI